MHKRFYICITLLMMKSCLSTAEFDPDDVSIISLKFPLSKIRTDIENMEERLSTKLKLIANDIEYCKDYISSFFGQVRELHLSS